MTVVSLEEQPFIMYYLFFSTMKLLIIALCSCRCIFMNMYVPITLKQRSGKVVKTWHIDGAHNIDEVLQFIWRDLFLSMLAFGNQRLINKIPDMLDDIEDILSWTALERLIYGGRKCRPSFILCLSAANPE